MVVADAVVAVVVVVVVLAAGDAPTADKEVAIRRSTQRNAKCEGQDCMIHELGF